MKVVRPPRALTDLVEIADYIAADDLEVADRFFDAFESSIATIKKNPKIGAVRLFKGSIETRMWFIRGFEKCLIFYTESATEIVILRVKHSARDYRRFFEAD